MDLVGKTNFGVPRPHQHGTIISLKSNPLCQSHFLAVVELTACFLHKIHNTSNIACTSVNEIKHSCESKNLAQPRAHYNPQQELLIKTITKKILFNHTLFCYKAHKEKSTCYHLLACSRLTVFLFQSVQQQRTNLAPDLNSVKNLWRHEATPDEPCLVWSP